MNCDGALIDQSNGFVEAGNKLLLIRKVAAHGFDENDVVDEECSHDNSKISYADVGKRVGDKFGVHRVYSGLVVK